MSTWIEYQLEAFVVSAQATGLAEDLYLVATEAGSSNTSMQTASGRWVRARDWRLERLGTFEQVMVQSVRAAAYCEGGMFQPKGRSMRPEHYIGAVRAQLNEARPDAHAHAAVPIGRDEAAAGRLQHEARRPQRARRAIQSHGFEVAAGARRARAVHEAALFARQVHMALALVRARARPVVARQQRRARLAHVHRGLRAAPSTRSRACRAGADAALMRQP